MQKGKKNSSTNIWQKNHNKRWIGKILHKNLNETVKTTSIKAESENGRWMSDPYASPKYKEILTHTLKRLTKVRV